MSHTVQIQTKAREKKQKKGRAQNQVVRNPRGKAPDIYDSYLDRRKSSIARRTPRRQQKR